MGDIAGRGLVVVVVVVDNGWNDGGKVGHSSPHLCQDFAVGLPVRECRRLSIIAIRQF